MQYMNMYMNLQVAVVNYYVRSNAHWLTAWRTDSPWARRRTTSQRRCHGPSGWPLPVPCTRRCRKNWTSSSRQISTLCSARSRSTSADLPSLIICCNTDTTRWRHGVTARAGDQLLKSNAISDNTVELKVSKTNVEAKTPETVNKRVNDLNSQQDQASNKQFSLELSLINST